jgi:hypothetical protein
MAHHSNYMTIDPLGSIIDGKKGEKARIGWATTRKMELDPRVRFGHVSKLLRKSDEERI